MALAYSRVRGDQVPDLSASDVAESVDAQLRRVSRQEALCRQVIGRLASSFRRQRGHHELGFARVGDFARERLGLSARELQSLARVASRLDELPRVAAAFEAGEIGWSQCRLLVSVATEETESDWLARARERTVRSLERLVCEVNREAVDHISEEDAKTVEGEMKLRFRMSCSRSVKPSRRRTP